MIQRPVLIRPQNVIGGMISHVDKCTICKRNRGAERRKKARTASPVARTGRERTKTGQRATMLASMQHRTASIREIWLIADNLAEHPVKRPAQHFGRAAPSSSGRYRRSEARRVSTGSDRARAVVLRRPSRYTTVKTPRQASGWRQSKSGKPKNKSRRIADRPALRVRNGSRSGRASGSTGKHRASCDRTRLRERRAQQDEQTNDQAIFPARARPGPAAVVSGTYQGVDSSQD